MRQHGGQHAIQNLGEAVGAIIPDPDGGMDREERLEHAVGNVMDMSTDENAYLEPLNLLKIGPNFFSILRILGAAAGMVTM